MQLPFVFGERPVHRCGTTLELALPLDEYPASVRVGSRLARQREL